MLLKLGQETTKDATIGLELPPYNGAFAGVVPGRTAICLQVKRLSILPSTCFVADVTTGNVYFVKAMKISITLSETYINNQTKKIK